MLGFEYYLERAGSALHNAGYVPAHEGVFTIPIPYGFGWISVVGNDYLLTFNVGIVVPEINKIAGKYVASIFGRKAAQYIHPRRGPPFIMTTASALLSDGGAVTLNARGGSKDVAIESLVEALTKSADALYAQARDLRSAVRLATEIGTNDQVQIYLSPVAYAMLGDVLAFDAVGVEHLSRFSDVEFREMYRKYVDTIRTDFFS